MIGGRVVGGSEPGNEVTTPHSPELRAFVQARLGDLTPAYGSGLVLPTHGARGSVWDVQAKALAALLREVADGIDPQGATPSFTSPESLSTPPNTPLPPKAVASSCTRPTLTRSSLAP